MHSRSSLRAHRASSLLALSALAFAACGSDDKVTGDGDGDGTPAPKDGGRADAGRDAGKDGGGKVYTDPDMTCSGLQCQQTECGTGTTSISGTVFDPAGRNPLYNVAVYVPNEEVQPLKSGAACDTCESLYTGKPIASALTDAAGKFMLPNVPVGTDVPLVIQVGKWRRQFKIPTVTACQDNPQAEGTLRLPRNSSEGDIPRIAVSTGGADTLECLLRRVGIDASEFVAGGSAQGRIQIFAGGAAPIVIGGFGFGSAPNTSPPGPSSKDGLWNSVDNLMKYDIVLLSCEGDETENMNQDAMHKYTDAGGRVFASHFHYSWFNSGPYSTENLASWKTGARDMGEIQADIVTSFPKGQALAQWLQNVNALQNGKLTIEDAKNNATVTAANTPSQAWINASGKPDATQYFSFNTPVPVQGADFASNVCGRVVFSDLHVGAASGDNGILPVPMECSDGELSPQEKALEFMLFDLSSCITPDTAPPAPPIVI